MSAAQRQSRRKTARQFFDEDEEPPAKRSKIESVPITNGASKSTAAKGATARTKRAKTSYDEDEDGFTFARKTRSKKATDGPVPASKPQTSPAKARAAPRSTTRSDSKTDSRVASTSSDVDSTRPRRRSARLSGDKEVVVQILPSATTTKRKRKSNELKSAEHDREGSPSLPQSELQIEKKRDGTKIALPFADTPVINRNKEMRAMKSKAPNRRSSVNSRGRRASSLIESGTSNAIPHSDVSIADFYKHISHSLLEPKRMRQLLTWTATRALPPKQHDHSRNANEAFTLEAARSIQEDLLKDFANKDEFSDWFQRQDGEAVDGHTAIIKAPNPRNSANALRLQKLEEDIARLKKEEKEWSELVKGSKTEDAANAEDSQDIDLAALDPAQAALFAELNSDLASTSAVKAKKRRKSKARDEEAQASGGLDDIAARMRTINSNLEPQIDLFADGIHKITQYRLAAERVADAVLGTTARKLEIREKAAQEATGTEAMGAKEVLSALAGALHARSEGR